MGLEADCYAEFGNETGEGKAHLETNFISFRGPFRFKILLSDISRMKTAQGYLRLETGQGPVGLKLGSELAERWYLKLRYPKSLIDKLGIKEDQRVSVLDLGEAESEEFWMLLRSRTNRIAENNLEPESDFIVIKFEEVEELARLTQLEPSMKRDGAIWALWPKGQKQIKQSHVMDACKGAGLVDVKVVSFSPLCANIGETLLPC